METARVDLKPGARVRILSVGGDLRLTGSDTTRLEAQAGRRGGLRVKTRDDAVEVVSASGCLVFLPSDCTVEIGTIGGDGRITDMTGAVTVASVGGDLKLRRLTDIVIQTAGGDLLVQRMRGRLVLHSLGGDALLDRIDGQASLPSVGGDLRVRNLSGSIDARADGDVSLGIAPAAGTRSDIQAKGDITCRVPSDASVRARLVAGGDLRLAVGDGPRPDGEASLVVIGGGEAELELRAGGDLALLGGAEADTSDLAGSITAQVEAALRQAEVEIDRELGEGSFRNGEIGDQVRRALDQAFRPAQTWRAGEPSPRAEADLSAERALILKMVADGRITAEEAETLFRALEAGG